MQEPCPAAMEIHFKQKKHLIKLKIKKNVSQTVNLSEDNINILYYFTSYWLLVYYILYYYFFFFYFGNSNNLLFILES